MGTKAIHLSLGLLLVFAAGACSSSSTKSGTTSTPAGSIPNTVTASDALKFSPPILTISVGQTVTWMNSGSINHTVTFDSGPAFDHPLNSGATVTRAFAAAGTFTFHCSIHGQTMHGTIVVK